MANQMPPRCLALFLVGLVSSGCGRMTEPQDAQFTPHTVGLESEPTVDTASRSEESDRGGTHPLNIPNNDALLLDPPPNE
jgi:hypothetical protein